MFSKVFVVIRNYWNNPDKRAVLYQIIALLILTLLAMFLVNNTLDNLSSRGISTGFNFLGQEAGFGIIQSLIAYDETYSFGRTFFVGLLNTLLVSFFGIIIATILGFIVGIARLSNNWLVSRIALFYIEIFRNIPLLIQVLFWYFAVLRTLPAPRQSVDFFHLVFINVRGLYIPSPQFLPDFKWVMVSIVIAIGIIIFLNLWSKQKQAKTGIKVNIFWSSIILLLSLPSLVFYLAGSPLSWQVPVLTGFNFSGGLSIIPEFSALLIALSIYTAAFIAEVVRAGILSVSKGQHEAAQSLGLNRNQTLRLIIIPQAMKVIIPPLTNQYLNLIKNSSLATAIGYPDLVAVFAGTTLNQTGQAVEVIAMTMAVYLFISLMVSLLMNRYNKKMALIER